MSKHGNFTESLLMQPPPVLPSTELLPCPFCGGEAKEIITDCGPGYQMSRVRCLKCPGEVGHTGLNARAYWNTRVNSPSTAGGQST